MADLASDRDLLPIGAPSYRGTCVPHQGVEEDNGARHFQKVFNSDQRNEEYPPAAKLENNAFEHFQA